MADSVAPFFSVVIPVYNRADALKTALESVRAQTCQDFEIVVVDDGSRDNPAEIVDAFNDPRIRFIRQENRGGGAARNTGLDAARGRFVALLDSDDQFLPHHLERMKDLLDGSTDLVGYAKMIVDRGNGRTLLKPPRALGPDEHMATYLLCDRGFVPTITIVVETNMARRIRYHEDLHAAEDTDFALRLFLAGCKFAMIEEPGAVWKDIYDPARTSAGRKGARLLHWIEELRPQIPARAYYGCRGWAIAKGIAPKHRMRALKLYLTALWHGCYRPRLAAIIFLQIFLSDRIYRRVADIAVSLGG
ncbi:MAG TPA: glycosyltransferase family 2 protein [Rhizomicrobium sp.]|jgi:glycosyltransferase involved in cell wall biosynthesis|nr:glycosyltransferase family 2 protein [Rhizomicrobium sp.]